MKRKLKKTKTVSFRLNEEIIENFGEVCDRLQVSRSYVISELVKNFIVRNMHKKSHEAAEIIPKGGD